MSAGLLDLPAPLFNAVDDVLAWVRAPALLRVVLYAAACAWLGMAIYRRRSDQTHLAGLRTAIAASQRALLAHGGDFSGLTPLIQRHFALSLRQLGSTLGPALLASLPLLVVLPWLSNRFDLAQPPADTPIAVCAEPATAASTLHWLPADAATTASPGCWRLNWPGPAASATLVVARDRTLSFPGHSVKSGIVDKFHIWNWLIGNAGGYLPATASAERVVIALPQQQMLDIGPVWLRGWEFWFFATLIAVSLGLRLIWRLH